MSARDNRATLGSMLGSLAWPIILGSGLAVGFYALLLKGVIDQPLAHRYFVGHPVCIVETFFFFVCVAALLQKLFGVWGQYAALSGISLGERQGLQPASAATEMLDKLAGLSAGYRCSYLGRRLTHALESVERNGSAAALESELKHLADVELGRQQDSYALVRIIVWATPMMGFLGTVIGITQVIAELAHQDMANLQAVMEGLLSGLYVKFDTTALALSYTMLLMFVQFLIDRVEAQVLDAVEVRAADELLGRFELIGVTSDPNVQAMQRMSHGVIKATEQLVQKQAELWQQSIAAAHDQWQRVSRQTTEQMQTALAGALSQSLAQHAAHLTKSEQASAEQLALRWEQWQTALSHNARLLHAQQQEMVKQGDLMTQAIRVAGDVVQLERALNDNLSALSGAKNFEDTVMSLAAAIHLLNARLGKVPDGPHIELKHAQVRARAA
ncbi:MAG TPA: MotA/TolQ/ExbB proton channel family protein [Pirellulaceae bacterium]|nr:MotA/TolQ/ExbB proton channel family protein [Pirellulaceae bacterium]